MGFLWGGFLLFFEKTIFKMVWKTSYMQACSLEVFFIHIYFILHCLYSLINVCKASLSLQPCNSGVL